MADARQPLAFITGATGMIGSHLARRLLDEGWRVRALARRTSDTALLRSWGVDLVEGDVADPAGTLTPHLEDADYVFHCAALVSDWAPLDEMVRVNVEGTRRLAEAAVACGRLKRFVFLSSMVVFGMAPQRDLDETAPLIHTGDHYNLTKIRAEETVRGLAAERGLPAVIVRPPYVYGPRDRQFLPRVLENLKNGKFRFVGSGRQPMSLCWVGNLVEALVLAARRPEVLGEVFLVTDGDAVNRVRLMEIICEETGYAMPTRHAPTWLVRLACPVMEGLWRLKGAKEPPLVNKFRLKFMTTPLTYRIEKTRRVLGYEPKVGTEAALRETLRWFREHRPDLMP
ncbi:MAG: NAD-dependent epimerase/dehydratase family protein [Phycisphaerae bacterium]|nr:NAD-dependent epimerase/dehydratase family protein [Phycisphaerae bacterium]